MRSLELGAGVERKRVNFQFSLEVGVSFKRFRLSFWRLSSVHIKWTPKEIAALNSVSIYIPPEERVRESAQSLNMKIKM